MVWTLFTILWLVLCLLGWGLCVCDPTFWLRNLPVTRGMFTTNNSEVAQIGTQELSGSPSEVACFHELIKGLPESHPLPSNAEYHHLPGLLTSWKVNRALRGKPSDNPVLARIERVYADSTWRSMSQLLTSTRQATGVDFSDRLTREHPSLMGAALLTMVETKLTHGMNGRDPIRLSTAATYVRQAIGLMERLHPTDIDIVPIMRMYARSLAKDGAGIPTAQARPLEQDQVKAVLRDPSVPIEIRALIFLCWKSASRVADVQNLQLPLTLDHRNKQMLAWFRDSKTAREHQFDERFITVVDWSDKRGIVPTDDVIAFLCQEREVRRSLISLYPKATHQGLAKVLKTIAPKAIPVDPNQPELLEKYTSHSLKRGALQHLWRLQPTLDLDLTKIQRLGSHKAEGGSLIGENAIRYSGAMFLTARSLGSQELTKLL